MLLVNLKGEISVQYQELEIKILDINREEIVNKLNEIGAEFVQDRIQKIYTYDCYDPILMYKLTIEDYKITKLNNSLRKIINMVSYIEPTFTEDERSYFKELLGYESIEKYITNNMENVDLYKLQDEKLLDIIKSTKERFFKWIRLRQDGDKVELTLKYIYNTAVEYNIDEVKEIEIVTDDFETANKLIEEMGYYKRKLVEKRRVSYKYNDLSIEIDEWPLLNPYIEIEGNNAQDIYDLALKLGYPKEETKVMNTEDVYLLKGINLTDYEVMAFDHQELA